MCVLCVRTDLISTVGGGLLPLPATESGDGSGAGAMGTGNGRAKGSKRASIK